jgi:hypothetical protein
MEGGGDPIEVAFSALDNFSDKVSECQADCLCFSKPWANPQISPSHGVVGAAGLTVAVNGAGSQVKPFEGKAPIYKWTSDEGGESNEINSSFKFTTGGLHKITLRLTEGCSMLWDESSVYVEVTRGFFTASTTAGTTAGLTPLAVQFNAADSYPPASFTGVTYEWSTTAPGVTLPQNVASQNVTFKNQPGHTKDKYTVTLTVKNTVEEAGGTVKVDVDSYSQEITVGGYDCNGDLDGTAYIDNCKICVGGNSPSKAEWCIQDCKGVWGGAAVKDDCGVCDGDNSTCSGIADCNGIKNGSAYTDNCGICVGGDTGKTACKIDCNGDWGGTAIEDPSGVCMVDNGLHYYGKFTATGTHSFDASWGKPPFRCNNPWVMYGELDAYTYSENHQNYIEFELTYEFDVQDSAAGCSGWSNGPYDSGNDNFLDGTNFFVQDTWPVVPPPGYNGSTSFQGELIEPNSKGVYTKVSGHFIYHQTGGTENVNSNGSGNFIW